MKIKTTTTRRERVISRLREIANDLSGIPMESLQEDVSFLELGFDSLFLTQLSMAYQKEFSVRITFRQLFDDLSTLAALSYYIDSNLPAEASDGAEHVATPPAPAQKVALHRSRRTNLQRRLRHLCYRCFCNRQLLRDLLRLLSLLIRPTWKHAWTDSTRSFSNSSIS